MRKIIILTILLIGFFSQAQFRIFGKNPLLNHENFEKKRMYYGYFLGVNNYGYKIDYKNPTEDIEVKSSIGFSVGLVGNLRLNDYFSLRFEPGFFATQRNLTYPLIENKTDKLREVKSANLHFPLLLKYAALRAGNTRPFLVAGLSRTLNLSSNQDVKDDNYTDRFRVKKWTNNYELGFGIDFYLDYFVFSPSIRGVFGMDDELIRDNNPNSPWTGNIEAMRTRAVFINFTFH